MVVVQLNFHVSVRSSLLLLFASPAYLERAGVPIVVPLGAHAVFLDAKIEAELQELDDESAAELLESIGQTERGQRFGQRARGQRCHAQGNLPAFATRRLAGHARQFGFVAQHRQDGLIQRPRFRCRHLGRRSDRRHRRVYSGCNNQRWFRRQTDFSDADPE